MIMTQIHGDQHPSPEAYHDARVHVIMTASGQYFGFLDAMDHVPDFKTRTPTFVGCAFLGACEIYFSSHLLDEIEILTHQFCPPFRHTLKRETEWFSTKKPIDAQPLPDEDALRKTDSFHELVTTQD